MARKVKLTAIGDSVGVILPLAKSAKMISPAGCAIILGQRA
jgi:hypothetical protein